jgi:hypothetical protein
MDQVFDLGRNTSTHHILPVQKDAFKKWVSQDRADLFRIHVDMRTEEERGLRVNKGILWSLRSGTLFLFITGKSELCPQKTCGHWYGF